MSTKLRWGLAVGIIAAMIVGFQVYESSMQRRGGLASLHFQTLSDRVLAETRLLLAETTQSPSRSVVVAGSRTSQSMEQAESDMRWEISPQKDGLTEQDLERLARDTQSKLMQIIDSQQQSLHWYYPHLRMHLNVSVTNSQFYHRSAVLLSLKCNT
jgi:hypothetical protein